MKSKSDKDKNDKERVESEAPRKKRKPSRRDFLMLAAGGVVGVGGACALFPFSKKEPAALPPAHESLPPIEVDISGIREGEGLTVAWRGKPVFIRRRTQAEIAAVRAVPLDDLKDPEKDEARVAKSVFNDKELPEWLVVMGICSHLGCVPLGQKSADPHGEFGGWVCPCHAAHYDASGRVRKGAAPKNLTVPPYAFLSLTRIRIG